MLHCPGKNLAGTRDISFHSRTVLGNPGQLVTLAPDMLRGIFQNISTSDQLILVAHLCFMCCLLLCQTVKSRNPLKEHLQQVEETMNTPRSDLCTPSTSSTVVLPQKDHVHSLNDSPSSLKRKLDTGLGKTLSTQDHFFNVSETQRVCIEICCRILKYGSTISNF